jgi:hypothetical protein
MNDIRSSVASVYSFSQGLFQRPHNVLDPLHNLFRCLVRLGKVLNEKQGVPHLAQIADTFPTHSLVNMKE